ncbi:MAG: hypothetical protein GZ091_17590 [Paludibacter sp.]|nr:hypothetical protein [Paludibacter sp.]
MKTIYFLLIISTVLFTSSCASALHLQKDGDLRNAVNISTTYSNKDIKVYQKNKELKYKIIYDGSKNSSPFLVRRYFLKSAPNELTLEIEKEGIRNQVNISKIREKPNFWIQGLWFFIDIATGATRYYEDIAINE